MLIVLSNVTKRCVAVANVGERLPAFLARECLDIAAVRDHTTVAFQSLASVDRGAQERSREAAK